MKGNGEDAVEVTVKEVGALQVAASDRVASLDEIGPAIMEVFRWVLSHGLKVASYPMALFPAAPASPGESEVRFDACVPVEASAKAQGDGEISIRRLPAGRVASARHRGTHRDVAKTREAVLSWMAAHGYTAAGPVRELYLVNPLEAEEDNLLIEVQVPLAGN